MFLLSTNSHFFRVIPKGMLETYTEDEILDIAKIGKATGPRYTLRELGVTSLKDFIRIDDDGVAESKIDKRKDRFIHRFNIQIDQYIDQ